jgi:hypothetical protein
MKPSKMKEAVHAIMFDMTEWESKNARRWLKRAGYDKTRVNQRGKWLIFRQIEPVDGVQYYVKSIGLGVDLIVGPKPKDAASSQNRDRPTDLLPSSTLRATKMDRP